MPITPQSIKKGIFNLNEQYRNGRLGAYRRQLYVQGQNSSWGNITWPNTKLQTFDTANRSSPIQFFDNGSEWQDMLCSDQGWSLAATYNGEMWGYGLNNYGQLGQGDVVPRSSPVQCPGGNWQGFLNTSAGITTAGEGRLPGYLAGGGGSTGNGDDWVLVKKSDNGLYAWGYNGHGQLGQQDTVPRSSPILIGTIENDKFVKVVYSSNTAIGIASTNRALWGWGYNAHGQLGLNATGPRSSPQLISSDYWLDISLTQQSCIGIKTSTNGRFGTMWTWGYNGYGQLGLIDVVPRSSPVQITSFNDWTHVTNGDNHTGAVRTGILYTWGYNGYGQLGQNDVVPKSSPVQVSLSITNGLWRDLHFTTNRSYGRIGADSYVGWGEDSHNLINDRFNGAVPRSSPQQIGAFFQDFYGEVDIEFPTTNPSFYSQNIVWRPSA
jgi:alpha-tubulin suppressor-like RCC1 family protein